ncbi:MAG TPA: 4Fe-4S binding protein [Candidatus Lokiarchaeia archaeon]|nr:4Fe-4S binding protein [Candidatus Lokiarchaeia archaeon]
MKKISTQPLIVLDIQQPSVTIHIDEVLCTGCGICSEVCPFGLPVKAESGKYEIANPNLCTECSACKRNCPAKAIVMKERAGCGCLYDAANRRIGKKDAKNSKSCCSG